MQKYKTHLEDVWEVVLIWLGQQTQAHVDHLEVCSSSGSKHKVSS
jgi:hypothetical protein